MKRISAYLVVVLILFLGTPASAQVVTYCCDQAAEDAYLAAIASQYPSATVAHESFESGPWFAARTVVRPTVTNLGITWSRSGAGLRTSTGGGDVNDGLYLMFASQLSQPLHPIPDGYRLTSGSVAMHGVGGWFTSSNSKIAFTVDGDPTRVDFTGAESTLSGWKFLGFIDTTAFTTVDIMTADEAGNETTIFFSDDFHLAMEEGPGTLQFSATDYSVNEDGTSITVTVNRAAGSAGAVSVNYATSDGSATASTDYSTASGTLNFADGVTSQTFNVSILDDSTYEGDESFSVNISGATGGATIGTPSTATVTITENDPAPPAGTLQFDSATYAVAEDGASLVVTVTRTGGSFGAVSASYASSDGSATAGNDYSVASGTVNFADGVISQTFSVGILDDTSYEGDENFTLSLSNATGGATIGTPSTTTVTITENDPTPPAGTLQFGSATYSVAENGTSLLVTVTRTGGSFGAVSASFASTDGSATAGSDYSTASGTVNFADGVVSQTFSVGILDDTDYEGDEDFTLNLSGATGGATIGTPSATTVTITENDPTPPAGTLQFSGASYSVAENGTSLLVTVTRTGGSFGAVSASYASADGSATAGSDYSTASGTVNFADGVISQTFSVGILDDTDYEGDETFTLSLSGATGGASIGTPSSATVTITENDPTPPAGTLQFSGASYSVAENGTSLLVTVTRNGGSFGAVSINYGTADGSATAGSDYSTAGGTLNFADGVISQTFSVGILDDSDYEGDESFTLNLSNATGGASIGAPSTATVTINEDDAVPPAGTLQFSGASYSVAENGTSVLITVTRTGGSFGAVGASFASTNGSATAGSDYSAANGTVNFADGVISQTFSVGILDDSDYEGDESFTLNLSNATGGASIGTPSTATVTINEDDSPPPAGTLQFSGSGYTVAENGTSVLVTVTRTGGSFGAVSVNYDTTDGSATAGSDYTTASGTLNFADGVISQTFSVVILDDNSYEGDEIFAVGLSGATGGASIGSPFAAAITIMEDDPAPPTGSLKFALAGDSVGENGGSIIINVTRTGGSFGAVSVDYASSDGTATAATDYTPVSGTLNFADGQTSMSFNVNILDDATYEGDENFTLNLSNVMGGASLGTPSSMSVTITEDDPAPTHGSLQFDSSTYTVAENAGIATITVSRTGGSDGTVSVDYATGDGSAVAGSDYSATSGWLIFGDGEVSQSFDVTILDDANYEGTESFDVALSAVTGGATIGNPSAATVTITEDDAPPPAGSLQFSGSQYAVAENGAAIEITVDRVGGSFGTVTVDYETNDDSALGGSDYTSVANTLSFADGEVSQSFFVPITDDAIYEGDEQFSARLLNATGGAAIGVPSTTTITITEDDPVPAAGSLQLSGANYSVAENGGPARVTVIRTGGSFGSVSVDLATSDGSATAGADYSSTMTTVVLPDGVTSQSVDIAITDDATYEDDESFTVTLSSVTGGASLGIPAAATVTIVEDDVPPPAGNLKFSGATYTVREDAGSVQITVTRTGGRFGIVSVDYASSDGSATAGSDYVASNGTLTFADGEVSRLIDLTIIDDSVVEGDENFMMQLSNVSGGATIGSPSSANVRISENDSRPPITPPPKKGGGGAVGPLGLLLALLYLAFAPAVVSAGEAGGADPHAQHRKMMSGKHVSKSVHSYKVEDLTFVGMNGQDSTLGEAIDTGNPVVVNFIFTTCTTICPVQTATFAQVQRELGEQADQVTLISVSIDPEHDTPSRLREYSGMFNAGPQWQFLTGSVDEMIDIQKAFDAYHGAKMNHRPLVLIRAPDEDQWRRLEGMASAADILDELKAIMSQS